MRIGIFTNNYIPIVSGVTESIESFRKELEARGHEIYIFAPRFPGHKDDNPNVFRYPSINYKYKTPFPIAITLGKGALKKAKELKLDVIHSQHPFNVGQDALKIARKLDLPILFTNHCRYDIYTHFIPLVPHLAENVQNVDHIIPTYWVRGGMSTRTIVRNIDYLKSCGIKN